MPSLSPRYRTPLAALVLLALGAAGYYALSPPPAAPQPKPAAAPVTAPVAVMLADPVDTAAPALSALGVAVLAEGVKSAHQANAQQWMALKIAYDKIEALEQKLAAIWQVRSASPPQPKAKRRAPPARKEVAQSWWGGRLPQLFR